MSYCVHGFLESYWNKSGASMTTSNCLSTVDFTKTLSYTNLKDKPTLFDWDYNSLNNLPVVINGTNGLNGMDGTDGKC